jgi:putative PIN family toxin of toxin-antitoxin system
MRVILDTNVLMSGIFFGGPPEKIINAWLDGQITFVVSPEIIDEYRKVAVRLGEKYPRVKIESLLVLALSSAEVVAAEALPNQVCSDPDDDKFIACAISAGVPVIVSGDAALKTIGEFQGVKILSPSGFVDKFL